MNDYADEINRVCHYVYGGTQFFRQEIIEVPGVVSGLLVTYDDVRDDERIVRGQLSWQDFQTRMASVKEDWKYFDETIMRQFDTAPEKLIGGAEGRTLYFLRGGQHPEQWTTATAFSDATLLLLHAAANVGPLLQYEVEHLRELVPAGAEHFRDFEHIVRVVFNYLFRGQLGDGQPQSRTEPESEGIEIRDVIFANVSEKGFWNDVKRKYSASEIVVDGKNTDEVTREDLRQLYCYLKPALGFFGIVVCRGAQKDGIHAFNRTLFKNFRQERIVLVICEDDLRRMLVIANRGDDPSSYLRKRMSEFTRSV